MVMINYLCGNKTRQRATVRDKTLFKRCYTNVGKDIGRVCMEGPTGIEKEYHKITSVDDDN
jgi:hypothetical protein